MNVVGIIVIACALASAVGYHNAKKIAFKYSLIQFAFLMVLLVLSWMFLVKCYEVPIHNNYISYVVRHSPSSQSQIHFSGQTYIDIIYDYNTNKEVKGFSRYGRPRDTKPRIEVETYIKVENSPSLQEQDYGYYDYEMTWLKEGKRMVAKDSMYLSYIDSCGLEPGNEQWLEGSFFILGLNGSNRQYFYPFMFYSSEEINSLWRREYAFPRCLNQDSSMVRNDSVWREFQWGRIIPMSRSVNSTGLVSYNYIPPTDSVIYNGVSLSRLDYRHPNPIFTAEDISRAVEVLWIDGLRRNGSEINIRSLTFDYIGPTEFSDMYPEPDRRELSKISFTDSTKLYYIGKNGLRFHVKFPDMENIQQIRMFVITLLLGGVLGLLFGLTHRIILLYWDKVRYSTKHYLHLNRKRGMWICTILLILLVIYIILAAKNAHVDAFGLDDNSSFGIFRI